MSGLQFRAGELQRAQQFARLCEAHAADAARCEAEGKAGPCLAHSGLAREYSERAFALVARIAARARQ